MRCKGSLSLYIWNGMVWKRFSPLTHTALPNTILLVDNECPFDKQSLQELLFELLLSSKLSCSNPEQPNHSISTDCHTFALPGVRLP